MTTEERIGDARQYAKVHNAPYIEWLCDEVERLLVKNDELETVTHRLHEMAAEKWYLLDIRIKERDTLLAACELAYRQIVVHNSDDSNLNARATLQQAIAQVRQEPREKCKECGGEGRYWDGPGRAQCPRCHGTGQEPGEESA